MKISEWLPNKTFTLLYKAARDGFDALNFHHVCDKKGPTLTIIQSKPGDFLFGGYTAQTWDGSGYKSDPTTFIFTLTNPHLIPPTRYPLKTGEAPHAIMCYSFYSAVFGHGHDIQVVSLANSSSNSMTNFPGSFADLTGKGKETFTGGPNFCAGDVEVYTVA